VIDISFETYLQTLTTWPVQQDVVSALDTENRVWFQRREANTELFTDATPMLTTSLFSVEVMSLDIDAVQTQATTMKAALNGFMGAMATDPVLICLVEDQADEYASKSLGDDSGIHVAAFQCRIIQA
jgi:uncharacterized protein YdbL (DUF1318 family)